MAQLPSIVYGCVGALARMGFVAPPEDVEDIIQQFFATQWNGLAERYDPERGAAAQYIYAAFARFVPAPSTNRGNGVRDSGGSRGACRAGGSRLRFVPD